MLFRQAALVLEQCLNLGQISFNFVQRGFHLISSALIVIADHVVTKLWPKHVKSSDQKTNPHHYIIPVSHNSDLQLISCGLNPE